MENKFQIAIIGGGLAGLANAIDLSQRGFSVVLLERKDFPRHKVCGEYVSNEIRHYLEKLNAFPAELNPKEINRLEISGASGKVVSTKMKIGGFGISRFAIDHFLAERAKSFGAEILTNQKVTEVEFQEDRFLVRTSTGKEITADVVIGAYGKRSNLDKQLDREFMNRKTSYVGIKHHFKADFPDNLVQLHNFSGGYCGLSRVENDEVNLCYLVDKKVLDRYESIGEMEQKHLSRNPHLKRFFENSDPLFDQPLVISQINFDKKPAVENHVLMSGDSAGLIHPFCGNGMAMAIRSAEICSHLVGEFLKGKIDREALERNYWQSWQSEFNSRLTFGSSMSRMLGKTIMSELGVTAMKVFPALLSRAVKLSHGNVSETELKNMTH